MRRQRRGVKLLAFALGLAVVTAACGNDDDGGTAADDTGDDAADETGDGEQATGGELILGAEQWPECLNPVTQCANASWLGWAALDHVLPRLMELDPSNEFIPSPVLDGEPELSGEGTEDGDGPFTVTYTIAEDAVWDDGTPITSTDIKFTWEAIMNTTGVVSTVGYEDITDIDDSDPQTAVVEFGRPVAAWPQLFGGSDDYVIKADAFEGNDISDAMANEVPFSGAPWVLESWSANEATFVPNENYWNDERVPLVDSVTMVPLEDTETEITALLSGEVHAIFPQPTPGIAEELADVELDVGFGATFEEIWFNQSSQLNPDTPLQDVAVREAIAHGIDRQRLLEEIVQPDIPESELLNCNGWVPNIGEWCDSSDWEDFEFDPDLSQQILEDDGWTLGDDGIYEKDGQKLSMTWQTVADNQRRTDTQDLIIPQLRDIGIDIQTDNYDAGTLFEQRLPQMQTEVMMYAWVTSPDPRTSDWATCGQIPSPDNDFSGQNNTGWCNEEASELMFQADETVDEEERLDITHQVGDAMRENVIALPLWQLPTATAWDPAVVEGPIGDYTSVATSGFFNMYDWSLAN